MQHGLMSVIQEQRGLLARVVKSGFVRKGDCVEVYPISYPAFSNDWRNRVHSIAKQVQPEEVITYSQLAKLAGVASVYCRVFPKFLKSWADVEESRIILGSHNRNRVPNSQSAEDETQVTMSPCRPLTDIDAMIRRVYGDELALTSKILKQEYLNLTK
jgi:alkylated DNA nucleotide flippase Atl1